MGVFLFRTLNVRMVFADSLSSNSSKGFADGPYLVSASKSFTIAWKVRTILRTVFVFIAARWWSTQISESRLGESHFDQPFEPVLYEVSRSRGASRGLRGAILCQEKAGQIQDLPQLQVWHSKHVQDDPKDFNSWALWGRSTSCGQRGVEVWHCPGSTRRTSNFANSS